MGGVFFLSILNSAFCYSMTVCFILNEIVADKESRMRETLRIMSLDRLSYALSFFITQGFFALFTSSVMFLSFYITFSYGEFGIKKNYRQY